MCYRYNIAAVVGSRQFPHVVSKNKKDGKREAADLALRTLVAEGTYTLTQTTSPVSGTLPAFHASKTPLVIKPWSYKCEHFTPIRPWSYTMHFSGLLIHTNYLKENV